MRIPDPKANTTTEAYLAYKAGYLEQSELKPVLYEPYLHFDGWLAYWAGLTSTYPVKNVGKNLFDKNHVYDGWINGTGVLEPNDVWQFSEYIPVLPNTAYTVSCSRKEGSTGALQLKYASYTNADESSFVEVYGVNRVETLTYTTPSTCHYIRVGYRKDIQENIQLEEGSTATSYEPYTGEPEMLTDEEALVAYLSGVTDTYPEEIKDPYDVRIVGYLRHLASIRWPEPDYPVNNEEFYLSTMEPTHTSNSEPSADIELDTAEEKIISVEAYGGTYQQTYSGKNLFNINTAPTWVGSNTTYSVDGNTLHVEGKWFVGIRMDVEKNTDYYVSATRKNLSPANASGDISIYGLDQSTNIVGLSKGNGTFNSGDRTGVLVLFYCDSGTEGNYADFEDIQIEKGTSQTSYEPYVGGAPSPRPDYPQTINVVTGEQTVNVRGKNMFNVNKPLENKYLDSSGGWTTSTYSYINQEYIVTGSSKLSFSFTKRNGSPTIRVGEFEADGTFIKRTLVSTASTLTLDALTNKIILSVDNLSPNYFDELQIELGSSPTSYQPYTSQSYPISLGSIELCKIGDYQDYIYKSGDDWYVHKEMGKITLDGSETWAAMRMANNWLYYTTNAGMVAVPSHQVPDIISSYFSVTTAGRQWMSVAGSKSVTLNDTASPNTQIRFTVGDSTNKLADFKTWLSTHSTTVYYALATATDTKITDATLIGQLDALAGADTYNEKTFIGVTATDPNLPALLKVEAYKY